jgi:nicotinamidase-related amidase
MPVTALDPRTALIVIDLQKGLVALPMVHSVTGVVDHVIALADAFQARGLPVVFVNVAGAPTGRIEQTRRDRAFPDGWTDLIPALKPRPQDHTVTKMTPGAFTNTGLEAHLTALGVTQIVIAGIATSNGVEVTARQAYELGLNIAFPIDAMTDADADAHAYSVTRVFPKIGETGTAGDIIANLKRSA